MTANATKRLVRGARLLRIREIRAAHASGPIQRAGMQEKFGKILVPTEEVVENERRAEEQSRSRKFFPGYGARGNGHEPTTPGIW